jgi:hypothetical protein
MVVGRRVSGREGVRIQQGKVVPACGAAAEMLGHGNSFTVTSGGKGRGHAHCDRRRQLAGQAVQYAGRGSVLEATGTA